MQINRKLKGEFGHFSGLEPGWVFVYERKVYMRTKDLYIRDVRSIAAAPEINEKKLVNAVNLETGELAAFDNNDEIFHAGQELYQFTLNI